MEDGELVGGELGEGAVELVGDGWVGGGFEFDVGRSLSGEAIVVAGAGVVLADEVDVEVAGGFDEVGAVVADAAEIGGGFAEF